MSDYRHRLTSYLSLFTATGTLLCCALPSLLVTLGLGATLAGLGPWALLWPYGTMGLWPHGPMTLGPLPLALAIGPYQHICGSPVVAGVLRGEFQLSGDLVAN